MSQFSTQYNVRGGGAWNLASLDSIEYPAGQMRGTGLSGTADILRTQLLQQDAQAYGIPLTALRVWDALQTNLPATAATDDLAIITGTLGTDVPTIQSSDGKATTITQYARFQFALPVEYVAAETVTLRLRGGMITTISDTTATVDVQAYKSDVDGASGSDLCSTSAISINSLTKANCDFTISSGSLSPGDLLDVRVAVAITDSATGTAVIGEVSDVRFLLDIRG